MNFRFKYQGSDTLHFKNSHKYEGEIVRVDDTRRITALRFMVNGRVVQVEGERLCDFKVICPVE